MSEVAAPRSGLMAAVGSMAAGTTISRATGVLRVLALVYVLGISPLADAYNLANTIPNMVYDVVLGGVLGATFIPVFIQRLTSTSEREAWKSISAVVTLAVVVLAATTAIFLALAPLLIDAFTSLEHVQHTGSAQHLATQRHVATVLLRWFVPQVFLYGLLSIGGALLNVRRRFGAPMWVPIANNVVCIGVLLTFATVAPSPSLHSVSMSPGQLALLGAGTTAGVLVQFLLLLPSLAKAKLGRLRWRWDLKDPAVRTVARLGSWTFGFVVINQAALFFVIALAFSVGGSGPVSSYTYAYAFWQMPYAIVAVSVMSAVTPDLATHHSTEDEIAFIARFGSGLRSVLAMMIPASVALFLLAKPAIALLLGHGNTQPRQTAETGMALAELSLGLVGFSVFQYVVRALQAMHRTKAAFWLYLGENVINVGAALLLVGPLGLAGIALSVSVGYSVAAVAGLLLLEHWLGHLGSPGCYRPLGRICASSAVMGLVIAVVSNLSGALAGPALVARVLGAAILGAGAYLGTAALVHTSQTRDRPGRLQDS
ncbi:MAG: murein biosynthesis integral membrane protein MurJ [Actinomycetes bacterium]